MVIKHLVPAALLSLGLAAAGAVSAQTTWNMATPYPDAEFHTQNIMQFAEDVSAATGGSLNITVHSGQSLFKHPEITRAVRTGQVDAGEILMGNLGNDDPIFSVDNLPFLIDGYDTARILWDAQRPLVEERMAEDGLVLLYAAVCLMIKTVYFLNLMVSKCLLSNDLLLTTLLVLYRLHKTAVQSQVAILDLLSR